MSTVKSLKWKVAQATEWRWWIKYLKTKDKAEYLEWKRGYWNSLLAKAGDVLPISPGSKILDAGSGPAGIFIVLEGHTVNAVDPLLDKYAATLSQFDKADYPYVTFHNLPLEDYNGEGNFDVVFCMNAINHVSDLPGSFDIIVEQTRPGGYLVVTIDAHNHSFFKHLFRLIPGDILHPHQYDLKEYEQMLMSRGCELVKTVHLKHEFFFDHNMLILSKSN